MTFGTTVVTLINYCRENHRPIVTTHVISAAIFVITQSVQRGGQIVWGEPVRIRT